MKLASHSFTKWPQTNKCDFF